MTPDLKIDDEQEDTNMEKSPRMMVIKNEERDGKGVGEHEKEISPILVKESTEKRL